MSQDPAAAVAERLNLPPIVAADTFNKPWRYWVLRYLAALAEQADFEGQTFGRSEAAAALDMLEREMEDLLTVLRSRRAGRRQVR